MRQVEYKKGDHEMRIRGFALFKAILSVLLLNLIWSQDIQAQVYGSRCAVAAGICSIAPQPVGSVCYCGQMQGRTIQ